MGILFSRVFQSLFGSKEVRILILGLDNAGKTTILYKLQNEAEDEEVMTIPTIGFNVETLQYKNIKFQVWDLGGQTSIRPYWRCYYPNTDAIIFVVDSADRERLAVARQELQAMLDEEELKDAILLVLANKQDQKGALGAKGDLGALGLPDVRNRQWSIQARARASGLSGLLLARRLHQGRIHTWAILAYVRPPARTFAMCSASSRCGCGSSGRRRSGLSLPFKMS